MTTATGLHRGKTTGERRLKVTKHHPAQLWKYSFEKQPQRLTQHS